MDYIEKTLFFAGIGIIIVCFIYFLILFCFKKKSQKKTDNPVRPVATAPAQKTVQKSGEKKKTQEVKSDKMKVALIVLSFTAVISIVAGVFAYTAIYNHILVGIGTCIVTTVLLIRIFYDTIDINHRAIPTILGKRIPWEFGDGPVLWFGGLRKYNMTQWPNITLSFIEKPIRLADGTAFKKVDLTLIVKLKNGGVLAYDEEFGEPEVTGTAREIAEDRTRNAFLAYSLVLHPDFQKVVDTTKATGDDDKFKEIKKIEVDHNELLLVAVQASISRLQKIIRKGNSEFSEEEQAFIESQGLKLLSDEEGEMSGLDDALDQFGIKVVDLTLSNMELPDEIQEKIDGFKTEPLDKMREARNLDSYLEMYERLKGKVAPHELGYFSAAFHGDNKLQPKVIIAPGGQANSADKMFMGLSEHDGGE